MPSAKSKSSKAVADVRKGAKGPKGKAKKAKSAKKKGGRSPKKSRKEIEAMLQGETEEPAAMEEPVFEELFPEGISKSPSHENPAASGSGQDMDALDREIAEQEDLIFDGEAVGTKVQKDQILLNCVWITESCWNHQNFVNFQVLPEVEIEDKPEPETTAEDQDDMNFAQIQEFTKSFLSGFQT